MRILAIILIALTLNADEVTLISSFENYVEKTKGDWGVPGVAVGIVKGDKTLLLRGFGQRGLKDLQKVDPDTLFQIGSQSKAFTAALTALLIDDKKLSWSDNVIDHYTSFHLKDPFASTEFQITDLFSQRSGLKEHAGDSQVFLGFSKDEMLSNVRLLEPASSFRSQFAYQNIFFVIAGKILEEATGKSIHSLFKERLFIPLEMRSTSTTLQDYLNSNNRAEWHQRQNKQVTLLPFDFKYRNWTYELLEAGGINASARDMVNWLKMQVNQGKFQGRQIVSSENLKVMHRPYIFVNEREGKSAYYGLGWVVQEYSPSPIIWHNGATLGAYSVSAMVPDENLGIVILTNVRGGEYALALAFQFIDSYFGKESDWSKKLLQMEKQEETKTSTSKLPSLALESYVGAFENPVLGKAEVQKTKDGLLLNIGKNGVTLPLTHKTRDTFTFIWPIVEESPSIVTFSIGNEGRASSMSISVFEEEGLGSFIRIK